MTPEVWIVLLILAIIVLPFALKRLWWWVVLWGAVGGVELASMQTTGHTLSQAFWAATAADPAWGWRMAGIIAVAGVLLGIHLVWRRINKR